MAKMTLLFNQGPLDPPVAFGTIDLCARARSDRQIGISKALIKATRQISSRKTLGGAEVTEKVGHEVSYHMFTDSCRQTRDLVYRRTEAQLHRKSLQTQVFREE